MGGNDHSILDPPTSVINQKNSPQRKACLQVNLREAFSQLIPPDSHMTLACVKLKTDKEPTQRSNNSTPKPESACTPVLSDEEATPSLWDRASDRANWCRQ